VPLWVERFLLAVLVAAFVGIVLFNNMKMDVTQRITLAIAILAFSYFLAYTIHKNKIKPIDREVRAESSEPKSSLIEQSSQGANSPNIIGDYNQVVINPDIRRQLDEIQKVLEIQASNLTPQKLLSKYPLGYVVFELDYENQVILYDSKTVLDKYDLDWTVVRFTKNTPTEVELRLPDARLKNGGTALTNIVAGGSKKVGNLGGFGNGDLTVRGEILAIQQNGIVFLVGFDRAPQLPAKK
jgi:hypothetical protein